ncbi:MAG TPA: CopG family transcriptional regulator [Chloroflexota bacterium]|jgi:hypothetical protein
MKRTTVCLPDTVAEILGREARRRSVSVSELTRQALLAYLGLGGEEPRKIPFAGIASSGFRHTARDAEEILAAEWDPRSDR